MTAATLRPEVAEHWQRRWDDDATRARPPLSRPRWDAPERSRPAKMAGETRRPGQRVGIAWADHRAELWSGTIEEVAERFRVTIETIRSARHRHAPPADMVRPLGVGVGRNTIWREHVEALWAHEVEVVAAMFGVTCKAVRGARQRHPRPSP